ncbi:MAG: hypothetical protein Q9210_003134 [Variospora velana]
MACQRLFGIPPPASSPSLAEKHSICLTIFGFVRFDPCLKRSRSPDLSTSTMELARGSVLCGGYLLPYKKSVEACLRYSVNVFASDTIFPRKEFDYHDCFDGFRCARLNILMDWNRSNLDDGHRVQLAVARLPAKVSVTDPRYSALLWLQSGGLGESGIKSILTYGKSTQAIVDSALKPDGDATGVIDTQQNEVRSEGSAAPGILRYPQHRLPRSQQHHPLLLLLPLLPLQANMGHTHIHRRHSRKQRRLLPNALGQDASAQPRMLGHAQQVS